MIHPNLERNVATTVGDQPTIFDLEDGLNEDEFSTVLASMGKQCTGNTTYTNGDKPWILSWARENASASSCLEGYIVVVTVSEPALLKVCVVCFVHASFREKRTWRLALESVRGLSLIHI